VPLTASRREPTAPRRARKHQPSPSLPPTSGATGLPQCHMLRLQPSPPAALAPNAWPFTPTGLRTFFLDLIHFGGQFG